MKSMRFSGAGLRSPGIRISLCASKLDLIAARRRVSPRTTADGGAQAGTPEPTCVIQLSSCMAGQGYGEKGSRRDLLSEAKALDTGRTARGRSPPPSPVACDAVRCATPGRSARGERPCLARGKTPAQGTDAAGLPAALAGKGRRVAARRRALEQR